MTSSTQAGPRGVGAPPSTDTDALLALGAAPPVETDGGATLLAWLRVRAAQAPVWRDDQGAYHVFRHADVTRIVADPATFSSDTVTRLSGGEHSPPPGTLLLMDPPRHRKMRRLVTQAFGARRVEALGERIGELAAELLDAIEGPETDLVDAFANPLPVTVIGELLGIPAADRDRFQAWADVLLTDRPDDPAGAERLSATVGEIHTYLVERVTLARAEIDDGQQPANLLGTLVQAEVDGERLDDLEVVSFAALLLLAGHVTTAVLLGNTLLCLDAEPAELAAVRADPGRVPAVIEEVLRLRPPFLSVERVTTREVEVGGETLPENAMIYLWLLSANRDERVFADPDAFRPGRPESPQVAFGHGIHFCLGAPLARMEGRIALALMLERFPSMTIDEDTTLSWHRGNVLGARKLPLRMERGARA